MQEMHVKDSLDSQTHKRVSPITARGQDATFLHMLPTAYGPTPALLFRAHYETWE